MENNQALGTERIGKLLVKFAVPCILSLLISALYNIVDQIFIGNSSLGYLGNAATSIVFPITIISFAFAWCFGNGAVALMSIRQGQKDTKSVSKIIGNALTVIVLVSLIFIAICTLTMQPLLRLFGASDASLPLAQSYFTIILAATTASILGGVFSNIVRADGSPTFSMVITMAGAIINIILDPIFIYHFDLGIEGAAYATIIGQIVSFLLGVFYLFFRARTFRLTLDSFRPHFPTIWQFTKLGASTFITQMAIVVTALVGNTMLAKYGALSSYGVDIPIAVMGITSKVFTIVLNLVVGLVVGAQPIIGFNYGAGRYDRVRETFRIVMITTVAIGLLATFIFQVFPDFVINIFGTSDELYMEFARKMFRIFLMLIACTVIIKAIAIFFQAVGEPVRSAISSLMRDLMGFVPLCLVLSPFIGIDGVLYAAPIADLLGLAVSGTLALRFYRRLGQMTKRDAKEVMRN